MENSSIVSTTVQESWDEQKAKLKQKFIILSDDDLFFKTGHIGWMFAKLQTKLGKTKEELLSIIAAL